MELIEHLALGFSVALTLQNLAWALLGEVPLAYHLAGAALILPSCRRPLRCRRNRR